MNTLEQARGRTLTLGQALLVLSRHGFTETDYEARRALRVAKLSDGRYCATALLLELGY